MPFEGKRSRMLGLLALAGFLAGILLTGAAVVDHAGAQDSGPAPLPACPPPGSLGPGTPVPGPDNVSWRYIQECSHCLAVTPTATGLPFGPTSTAVMRSFRSDCAQEYVFQLPVYQILTDNVQESETYGVIFTPHNDGPMLHAAWQEDPQVTWLMPIYSPDAGTYLTNDQPVCLVVSGYEYLCGQFAPPNADIRTMGYLPDGSPYIPHPSFSQPLALGINAGGDIIVSDVRVIFFGSSSASCALPTPTPTSTNDWSKSCNFDRAIPQNGGFTHYEAPVGGTVGGVSWSGPSPLAGYVFYMYTQGADVSIGPAVSGPSFFDASLAGYQFQDGFYCLGSYDACAVMGPSAPFTWLENTEKDVASTTFYMPFNIDAADARTIMLDNGYWIARGTFQDCQGPVVTATPAPSATPAVTATPVAMCAEQFGTVRLKYLGTQLSSWTYTVTGSYEMTVASTLKAGQTSSYMQHYFASDPQHVTNLTNGGSIEFELIAGPATTFDNNAVSCSYWNGAGSQNATEEYITQSPTYIRWKLTGGVGTFYFHECQVDARTTVGVAASWTVRQLGCNGGAGYMTPTPAATATMTLTPFPTWTPVASPTPTATPLEDPDRCRAWEWKPAYPPVVSLGDDFGDDLLEEGECYGIIPGMHISVPDLGAVGDLVGWDGAEVSWDAFGYCVTWVNMPAISILGLSISVDWFLLPAVAWLLNKLVEMS